MNKIFLSVTSMLLTHFILKIVDKVKGRGPTKEELHRKMNAEYEAARRADEQLTKAHLEEFLRDNPPGARFTECAERIAVASTPMNGTRLSPIAQANLNLMESCRNG